MSNDPNSSQSAAQNAGRQDAQSGGTMRDSRTMDASAWANYSASFNANKK